LDRPLEGGVAVFGWDTPDRTLREMLERIVFTKEVWAAALTGGAMPKLDAAPDGSGPRAPAPERTPAALLARFENADAAFTRALADVRDRGAWDDTFVDALCEPPEAFTFGGTFAHVVTFNAFRRLTALDALRRLGAPVEGVGCPMEYEEAVAPWRAPKDATSGA
jgi:AraC family transcriptional regulator